MKRSKNLTPVDDLITHYYGEIGTPERDEFEKGCEEFILSELIKSARKERGLTQEQLAQKIGTTKAYISRLENNINEVRFSTLKKIIEVGLGGHLDISVRF